jgi:hypothetical protein
MSVCRLILLGLLISTSLNSQASIGTVTELLNTPPSIQRKNSTLTGSKGTGVEMNDSVKTAVGKVGITFEDQTRVQVNENSRLVIDDFVYDPKSKAGKLGVKVALGTVRYASGQIAKNSPQNVAVNTPTATISVRGTDFTATVDEVGSSTIILLPSCPDDKPIRNKDEVNRNCVVGTIVVETDVGQVIMNQAFQATTVASRSQMPRTPVILNLSEDAIGNILILSPPRELAEVRRTDSEQRSLLDIDFLKFSGLDENSLEKQNAQFFQDQLARNFLENHFLDSLFDIIGDSLNEDYLADEVDSVLPDWRRSSGIIVTKDEGQIGLCRDNGSDIQCVTTPLTQNSLVTQIQGSIEFSNRINEGGNTIITIVQR